MGHFTVLERYIIRWDLSYEIQREKRDERRAEREEGKRGERWRKTMCK